MRNVLIGVWLAAFVVGSMVVSAAPDQKKDCAALLKAVAAFTKTSRDIETAEEGVRAAEKAIDTNTADQQRANASIADATAQLAACRKRSPNNACTLQQEKEVAAEQFLATLQAGRTRLDWDLKAAKDLLVYR